MSASNNFSIKVSGGFAVAPIEDCPHVTSHVNKNEILKNVEGITKRGCMACNDTTENWLCLGCGSVLCSRYIKGHMAEHNQNSKHAIALSFADLSYWCYECSAYILDPALDLVHREIYFDKFACYPENYVDDEQMPDIDVPPGMCKILICNIVVLLQMQPAPSAPAPASTNTSNSTTTTTTITNELAPSNLTAQQLDKILGIIYGNALGDAIGLSTEFLDTAKSKDLFGDLTKKLMVFPNFTRTYHSSRWKAGDWTDDTDQLILIMQSLLANDMKVNLCDFAKRLKNWMKHGFAELGDFGGMGIGFTVSQVLHRPNFETAPKAAAYEVWDKLGKNLAANGAVMRTAILGCMSFHHLPTVVHNTLEYCQVTHADTRCFASCVAITSAIALILQGKTDVQEILNLAKAEALKHLDTSHVAEFVKYFDMTKIDEMELDEEKSIGYTFKCMSCGLYGLRNAGKRDFKWIINDMILKGGDADTNACVAGALVGAMIGYSQLPQDYIKAMPNKQWLDKIVIQFCVKLGFDAKQVQDLLK